MRISDGAAIAARSLSVNKTRALLTALGVIIGVAAVITLVSVGEGAKRRVSQQIQSLGSNLLVVTPGRPERTPGGGRGGLGSLNVLTLNHVAMIAEACSSVVRTAPETSRMMMVKVGKNSVTTQVFGVTPEYLPVRNYEVAQGGFFSGDDVRTRRKVAVLGSAIADELLPEQDAVGQTVRIGTSLFKVVGVMKSSGQSGFTNLDDRVYVPITTAQKKLLGSDAVRTIYVQVRDEKSMAEAEGDVNALLESDLGSPDLFLVRNQQDVLSAAQDVAGTLTMQLAAIASISLIVGGIGIMNIMLVSVAERTREIGIRKAVGATRRDVLTQFLMESTGLSTSGGLVGVAVGWIGARVIGRFGQWPTAVSAWAVITALAFSVAVGVFFGMYPAVRASRLHPIEALRYE